MAQPPPPPARQSSSVQYVEPEAQIVLSNWRFKSGSRISHLALTFDEAIALRRALNAGIDRHTGG